jgi:hypothetical protein
MAEPRITKIIYREYAEDLFDGQDTTGIDMSASTSEFLAQLKAHLEQEYPGVRVVTEEVTQPIGHDRRIIVETKPTNDEDGAALRLSEETAFSVSLLAADDYERGEWYVEVTEEHKS